MVIIGAGMAGLAAGIRLAMFDKDVIILERHNAPGGLNSFYSIDGRKYDVGLHAVTNYVPRGTKGTPLTKLLRQLRIRHEDFQLAEQMGSKIAFPGVEIDFTNDFAFMESEVERTFPDSIDGFRALAQAIREYEDTALDKPYVSAREVVARHIPDPLLREMLFCPVMYYGSSEENDMDFAQFAIMFKALFFEGFARPYEGVRVIIRALLDRYRTLGGKRKMKCGVRAIRAEGSKVSALELDDGSTITADRIISSAGQVETLRLCQSQQETVEQGNVGRLSFAETITILDKQPIEMGCADTIIFFNDSEQFHYQQAAELIDYRSGVICFPNNYQYPEAAQLPEGIFRVTAMANYAQWKALNEESYLAEKKIGYELLMQKALQFLPQLSAEEITGSTVATDMFTPLTVEKFTGHLNGAIYGATRKIKDGRTPYENLFLCGTDQGFLGIIGAMLSGISMANLHVLSQ